MHRAQSLGLGVLALCAIQKLSCTGGGVSMPMFPLHGGPDKNINVNNIYPIDIAGTFVQTCLRITGQN